MKERKKEYDFLLCLKVFCLPFFLVFISLFPTATQAANILVNTATDSLASDGSCSLREAIRNANSDSQVDNSDCQSGSGDDMITIPKGTYTLTLSGTEVNTNASATNDLDINSNLILRGDGDTMTVIDGNGIDSVFQIEGSSLSVTMIKMTITGGSGCSGGGIQTEHTGGGDSSLNLNNVIITANSARAGCGGYGGGLLIDSNFTANLNHLTVSQNTADSGGGIYISSLSDGTTIENSTISENSTSEYGGGIATWGPLTVRNSTISNNTASSYGGGLSATLSTTSSTAIIIFENSTVSGNSGHNGGGIYVTPSTFGLYNVTLASNSSDWDGGGLYVSGTSGTITLLNTLIGDNTASQDGNDCHGTIDSLSYSLIEDSADCTITSGTPVSSSPQLDTLADYRGRTETHRLQTGSPAIDAGDPTGCQDADGNIFTMDQRGSRYTRPVDGDSDGSAVCDMGAFERQR